MSRSAENSVSVVSNTEECDSVLEARVVIGQWRDLYNNTRRH